jgi:hypothetical protein
VTVPDPYIIVTGTELDGTNWAKGCGFSVHKRGAGVVQDVAWQIYAWGGDPTRPVRIVNDNGGKLRSAKSLAELGRVK